MTGPSPGLHTENSVSKQTNKRYRRRKEVRSESRDEEDKKRDGKGRRKGRRGGDDGSHSHCSSVTMEPMGRTKTSLGRKEPSLEPTDGRLANKHLRNYHSIIYVKSLNVVICYRSNEK